MHYSLLNSGSRRKDYFDPKEIIDVEEDDVNHFILKDH